ncbi:unnamed protein product [Leptidea sinapis]|uniref:Uncharacterized protein n=1 Tax=Leptidea sinapis TaxID=189913 RepID=A0A5E4QC97_9NEOP|nr:unnamed protein product [Leptidea sinapis]
MAKLQWGGQLACSVAKRLGISVLVLHKYAGILSAYGMALADVVQEAQQPCALVYSKQNYPQLDAQLKALGDTCRKKLRAQPYLHLRYSGTDCALMVYKKEFGFTLSDRDVIVDDVRVRGVGRGAEDQQVPLVGGGADVTPNVDKQVVKVYFEGGYQDTSIYLLDKLLPGQEIVGPAIIMDSLSTILVEPGEGKHRSTSTECDAILLSIFSHRFMSIAEQMGRSDWTFLARCSERTVGLFPTRRTFQYTWVPCRKRCSIR